MPMASVNGISFHYEYHTAGTSPDVDGPPLLLLSGLASDSASWAPVIEPLGKRYDLLLPDNRCTGRTLPNPVHTSRDTMTGDLLALLDLLHIPQVNVIGHSMGGMLGWALAAEAPERVAHLISVAALPQIQPARIALFQSMDSLRTDAREQDWFELLYQFLFRPEFFDNPSTVSEAVTASMNYPFKQTHTAFSQQVAALSSFLPALPLHRVTCPVTLLTGSLDILMPPRLLESFVNSNLSCQTQVIDGAAHALHWEKPGEFIQAVDNALRHSRNSHPADSP